MLELEKLKVEIAAASEVIRVWRQFFDAKIDIQPIALQNIAKQVGTVVIAAADRQKKLLNSDKISSKFVTAANQLQFFDKYDKLSESENLAWLCFLCSNTVFQGVWLLYELLEQWHNYIERRVLAADKMVSQYCSASILYVQRTHLLWPKLTNKFYSFEFAQQKTRREACLFVNEILQPCFLELQNYLRELRYWDALLKTLALQQQDILQKDRSALVKDFFDENKGQLSSKLSKSLSNTIELIKQLEEFKGDIEAGSVLYEKGGLCDALCL